MEGGEHAAAHRAGNTRQPTRLGLLLVSISVGPRSEFGEGDSLGLVVLSLLLGRE